MIVELRNFHVIIMDLELFDKYVFNLHTIFFEEKRTKQWEVLLAEVKGDS
jgi:endonuclease/exonuclease/phosphatase family metal-dependent hydrolase